MAKKRVKVEVPYFSKFQCLLAVNTHFSGVGRNGMVTETDTKFHLVC
jgi:hypothetical protein